MSGFSCLYALCLSAHFCWLLLHTQIIHPKHANNVRPSIPLDSEFPFFMENLSILTCIPTPSWLTFEPFPSGRGGILFKVTINSPEVSGLPFHTAFFVG